MQGSSQSVAAVKSPSRSSYRGALVVLKSRTAREHSETKRKGPRSPFEHDRDRVLYSEGFRRLGGITQVSAAAELQLLHTRLTHSLKVAQVGRSQVQLLLRDRRNLHGIIDSAVVETAALAHDIGHPPFGHAVEEELNSLMQPYGGFEGNAQSLRYVAKLARRSHIDGQPRGTGALDLTRASLAAILKYPRLSTDQPEKIRPDNTPWYDRMYAPIAVTGERLDLSNKWNAYVTELATLKFARQPGSHQVRSIEAAIMDWADDVSYAVHDIEDYLRAGLIPTHIPDQEQSTILDKLDNRMNAKHGETGYSRVELDDAAREVFEFWAGTGPEGPTARYRGGLQEDHKINKWVNRQLTAMLNAARIDRDGHLAVAPRQQYQVEILKYLTVFYVIDLPRFAASQHGQRRVVRELFAHLSELLEERPASLPPGLGQMKGSIEAEENDAAAYVGNQPGWSSARAVCDYLCTLTEGQALDLYDRLSGHGGSMIGSSWY